MERWPKLESFTLTGSTLFPAVWALEPLPEGVFQSCSKIITVNVGSRLDWQVCASLVARRPANLTALHLTVYNPFAPSSFASPVIDHLALIAPSLTEFQFNAVHGYGTQPTPRGLLDRLVRQLPLVERLTVPACAVTNPAATLGQLPRLTKLDLLAPRLLVRAELSSAEVTALLRTAASLRVLGIHAGYVAGWSAEKRDAVERVARDEAVELTLGED